MGQPIKLECLCWVPAGGWSASELIKLFRAVCEDQQLCPFVREINPEALEQLLLQMAELWAETHSASSVLSYALLTALAEAEDQKQRAPEVMTDDFLLLLRDRGLDHANDFISGLCAERMKGTSLNFMQIWYVSRQLLQALKSFQLLGLGYKNAQGMVSAKCCSWSVAEVVHMLRLQKLKQQTEAAAAANGADIAAHTSAPESPEKIKL